MLDEKEQPHPEVLQAEGRRPRVPSHGVREGVNRDPFNVRPNIPVETNRRPHKVEPSTFKEANVARDGENEWETEAEHFKENEKGEGRDSKAQANAEEHGTFQEVTDNCIREKTRYTTQRGDTGKEMIRPYHLVLVPQFLLEDFARI